MKKVLLFVTLLLGTLQALGAFYFPLNQEWKFMEDTYCEEGWKTQIKVISFDNTLDFAGKTYYAYLSYFLRSEGNKVFYHVSDDIPDVVLYDFDLQIGDSLIYFQEGLPSSMIESMNIAYSIVTDIDTLTLLDGRQARRLHYNNRAADIEYVGSELGLLGPLNMPIATCMKISLLCASINGEPIYETSPGACSSTGLPELETSDSSARKLIQDGQLIILKDGVRYNSIGVVLQ